LISTLALHTLGHATRALVVDAGAIWRLAVHSLRRLLGPLRGEKLRLQAAIEQGVRAGWSSLPLVALICLLVGMILALQSAYQLRELGATDLIPSLVGLSITRELAPLLTAFVVAGRYGSSIAAEIGTMKVSQEIDALEVIGIDPVAFLVVPRLLALLVSLPCLTVFADLVGILGGQLVSVGVLGMGAERYLLLSRDALVLEDIYTGLVKAVAFAMLIGLVSCHQGLGTRGGAEAVGRSTTTAVVRSIVLVVVADLFVTALFFARGQ
jgi:phospholipid/cholesterol/gamma-HCH transport system permease protein